MIDQFINPMFTCNYTEMCTNGTVRINGGSTSNSGVVEVCVNSTWGAVCANNWNIWEASIVCRELGYPNGWYSYVK